MLQPDRQSTDEVVQVFTGDTLEEAMSYAVAALGPDLTVRRARRIRKGVQGLVGKDRYEVVALPSPEPPSDDAVGSAFDALLSQAEAAELPLQRVRRTTRPTSVAQVPHPSPAVAEHTSRPIARAAFPTVTKAPVIPAPRPAAPVIEACTPAATRAKTLATSSPARKTTKAAAPARAKPATTKAAAPARAKPATTKAAAPTRKVPAPRSRRTAGAGWSRRTLATLGLPTAVLDALPTQDPVDDLAWVVALAVAMSAVLPAPAALDDTHPLVVNGFGMPGVLGLLDAASRGLTPGTITVGDRTVPATATELALAVHACLVRGAR